MQFVILIPKMNFVFENFAFSFFFFDFFFDFFGNLFDFFFLDCLRHYSKNICVYVIFIGYVRSKYQNHHKFGNLILIIISDSFLFDSILMKYRGHSRVLKSYDVKAISNLVASSLDLQPPPWPPSLPQGPLASVMAPSHPHGPPSSPIVGGLWGRPPSLKMAFTSYDLRTLLWPLDFIRMLSNRKEALQMVLKACRSTLEVIKYS